MPSILTVNGSRVDLEADCSYLLGRDPECDFVVEDMTVSRRHARISLDEEEKLSIEDLESHNGTFVNEKRITKSTSLSHGSRVQIGASVYLVSLDEEDEDATDLLLDTGTIAVEQLTTGREVNDHLLRVVRRGGADTNFAGQLGSFGLVEILQVLIQTHRSGTLHLAFEAGQACVDIRHGEVQSASYQELEGFPALLMLARQKSGVFWLVDTDEECRRTIREPTSRLLFELCRALDEKSAV